MTKAMSRFETTAVLCGGCGVVFGGRIVAEVDAVGDRGLLERVVDGGLAALNPLSCPSCGWQYQAAAPLLVHGLPGDPVLILPGAARHTLRTAQSAAWARLVPTESALGALTPALRVIADDDAGLATVLLGEPTINAQRDSDPALDAINVAADPDDDAEQGPTAAWPAAASSAPPAATPEPSAPAAAAPQAPATPPVVESAPPVVDEPPPVAAPPVDTGAEQLLAELLRSRPAASKPPPSDAPDGRTDAWEAIGEGWSLQAVPARPDDDPTHVVSLADLDRARPGGPPFDPPADATAYLRFDEDGRLIAAARVEDSAAVHYDGRAALRFQLHTPPAGPLCGLLLVALDDDGERAEHVFWPIDDGTELGARVLDTLATSFAVEVHLYVDPSGPTFRRHYALPLEQNVQVTRRHLAEHPGDRTPAMRAVHGDDFDRVGRLRHNFQADSFVSLDSAAEARLAIGILGYWSAPERRDYLIRVKSFPLPWYEAITRRVLEGAVHFGLAMEPPMRQRSFDLKLAANSASLLRRQLANFAEVNLNLRPCELDVFDIWDNWEALLAHAEELDLRVDEEIEELAARSMERARAAAQEAEPLEIHLSEESIELEEVFELDELSDEGLVASLARPDRRLEAALVLLQRPGTVHVPAIFDALMAMPRPELLQAVPAALAKGPAFETHLLGALQARRTSLRLASALFLSEIRSERALTPLLALLPSAEETEWPVISRAAARMGRRIIGPALDLVESEGDADGRMAHTLALLGGDARGALAAARDQRTDARARNCLSSAISQMNSVSFGDAADFGERLADAFDAAGPDRVSPEFSEVLESIDLGPGASISGLDANLDLDE